MACPPGFFKEGLGNNECLPCPVPRSTTLTFGADSSEQCVCPVGYFMMPNETMPTCEPCASTHKIARDVTEDVFGSNCTAFGTGLASMPVVPGFWRQRNVSRLVRKCLLSENCIGGSVSGDDSCAVGQTGPLCGVCASGYHGGKGGTKRCQLCVGDPTLGLAVPLGSFVLLLTIIGVILKCAGPRLKKVLVKMVLAKQAVERSEADEIMADEEGEEDEEEGPVKKKKKTPVDKGTRWWAWAFKVTRSALDKLDDMGVKIKILICERAAPADQNQAMIAACFALPCMSLCSQKLQTTPVFESRLSSPLARSALSSDG